LEVELRLTPLTTKDLDPPVRLTASTVIIVSSASLFPRRETPSSVGRREASKEGVTVISQPKG